MDRNSSERAYPSEIAVALRELDRLTAEGAMISIRERAGWAVARLCEWRQPTAAVAVVVSHLLDLSGVPSQALVAQFGVSVVALGERLQTWRALLNADAATPAVSDPDPAQISLWLRRLYREAYLDLPQLTFILALVADHDARVECGEAPSPPLAAVTEAVLMPLVEMLGLWQLRQRWLERTVPVRSSKGYRRVRAVLGPDDAFTKAGMRRMLADSEVIEKRGRGGASDDQDARAIGHRRARAEAYFALETALIDRFAAAGLHPRPRVYPTPWLPGATLRRVGEESWTQPQWVDRLSGRMGIIILCASVDDCYRVLGLMHALGKPVSGDSSHRFDDFIASPQPNGYRALQTSIVYRGYRPSGAQTLVGVRILTPEMHRINSRGVVEAINRQSSSPGWWNHGGVPLRRAHASRIYERSSLTELLRNNDLGTLSDPLYVFTPRGEIILLAPDSRDRSDRRPTALDFAYHVHTEVGHRVSKVELNGDGCVPLHQPLTNGDLVRVYTDPFAAGPDLSWLPQVSTAHASAQLRKGLTHRAEAIHHGRAILENRLIHACRQYWREGFEISISLAALDAVVDRFAASHGHASRDELYQVIADKPSTADVITTRMISMELASSLIDRFGDRISYPAHLITFCGICKPIPGQSMRAVEHIKPGIANRLVIHRPGCRLIQTGDRVADVQWMYDSYRPPFLAQFQIFARDRHHILNELLNVFYEEPGVYLHTAQAKVDEHGKADIKFTVRTTGNERQAARLQQRAQRVRGTVQVFPHPITLAERSHIAAQSAGRSNPYTLHSVVKENFYDREHEVGAILRWIDTGVPADLMMLHGQRRVGKTSLIRHLAEVVLPSYGKVIPVSVDFQGLTKDSFSVRGVVAFIVQALETAIPKSVTIPESEGEPSLWLSSAIERALHFARERRIVVLIDEFTSLIDLGLEQKIDRNVFNVFRYIFDRYREMNWLIVVQDEHLRHPERWGSAGPVLQMAGRRIGVERLDPTWTKKLIEDPSESVGVIFDEQLSADIAQMTGGSPLLVQGICASIVEPFIDPLVKQSLPHYVQQREVDLAINHILTEPDTFFLHFLSYLRDIKPFHREVLLTVAMKAQEGEWMSFDEVIKYVEGRDQSLNDTRVIDALGRLERTGMVEVARIGRQQSVRVPVPLFQRWLCRSYAMWAS